MRRLQAGALTGFSAPFNGVGRYAHRPFRRIGIRPVLRQFVALLGMRAGISLTRQSDGTD